LFDQLAQAVDSVIQQLLYHDFGMNNFPATTAFGAREDEVAAEPGASFPKLVTLIAPKGKRGVFHSFNQRGEFCRVIF
jgi:hypothetical protein